VDEILDNRIKTIKTTGFILGKKPRLNNVIFLKKFSN
jgi:hypothetical protein